jgi:hypothetical protein
MNLDYRRAALLSCHHAAAQSHANRAPAVLPPRVRPLHHDVAADLFARSTEHDDLRARGEALAILKTARRGFRHRPLLPPHEQTRFRAELAALGNGEGCACCRAREAHARVSGLPVQPTVTDHPPPVIHFDSERMTTEVTTTLEADVSPEDAARLLSNADPRNWKRAAPDFFLASDPGVYERGSWTPQPWQRKDGGHLRETVHWNWNADNTVAVDNILSITNFKADARSISYDYSLYICLRSRMLVVWDSGGLDVDDGHYKATYHRGTLRIKATKRVRFTAPPNGPFEIALALNLMAPATVSMLLQNLVTVNRDGQPGSEKGQR